MKKSVETLIQFAVVLLEAVGLFLTKPSVFDYYHSHDSYPAGNFPFFISLALTCFLFIAFFTYREKKHSKIWLAVAVASSVFFIISYYHYGNYIEEKTFLVSVPPNNRSVRVIKGDNFFHPIQVCRDSLRRSDPQVQDIEVIRACAEIENWSEMDKIWPKTEIVNNANKLTGIYCLCLFFCSVFIMTVVQSIRCFKTKAA